MSCREIFIFYYVTVTVQICSTNLPTGPMSSSNRYTINAFSVEFMNMSFTIHISCISKS
jgi:hypothetical protein